MWPLDRLPKKLRYTKIDLVKRVHRGLSIEITRGSSGYLDYLRESKKKILRQKKNI